MRERGNAPPSKHEIFFTIQDNFALFDEELDSPPILLPNSDYFVPADIIEINLPLYGTFSHTVEPSDDPIANLLYANLKIKQLLEEYAAIQERAKLLLEDTSTTAQPTGKIQVNPETSIKENVKQNLFALSTIDESQIISTEENEAIPEKPGTEFKKAAGAYHHLKSKIANQKMQTRFSGNTNYDTLGKIQVNAGSNSQTSSYDANFPSSGTPRSQESYQDTISLPWILELPFKIFQYFMDHKITALVIGFLTLLLVNIIFGSRS